MSQPVYKFFRVTWSEAWYQLSQEERDAHLAKIVASLDNVGGERVILCESAWSAEPWQAWGVEKYPDVESAQRHAKELAELNHARYVVGETMLGSIWVP